MAYSKAVNIISIALGAWLSVPTIGWTAALANKSITIGYTTTIPAKGADGSDRPRTRSSVRTIYVSSAGRIFTRLTRHDGRQSDTRDLAPDQGSNLHFAGNTIVGVMRFASGAAQMTISFDPEGRSCSVSIISGRDASRVFRFKGLDGETFTATGPAQFSNVSCSIADGNAFGE